MGLYVGGYVSWSRVLKFTNVVSVSLENLFSVKSGILFIS